MKKQGGFDCLNCGQRVPFSEFIGTKYRNHCPFCLWSKHVDFDKAGDRKAGCQTKMKPLGLTFKREGKDKYGSVRQGELMLIHECLGCARVSLNRIAGDDDPKTILNVFKESRKLPPAKKKKLEQSNIRLLTEDKAKDITVQLFGKIPKLDKNI